MSILLAFDTSTAACTVALKVDQVVFERHEIAPRRHGNLLLPMIQSLLNEAQESLSSCDAIAFGQGPGSFMGVRIAAATAQGLAFAMGLPVIPVSSLQVLAQTAYALNPSNEIIAGWDARMNQIYWGHYEQKSGYMQPKTSDQLLSPETIQCSENSNCLLAGNAWEIYQEQLPETFNNLQIENCYPSASALVTLADYFWEAGQAVSAEDADVAYVRNDVAQPKLSK